MSNGTVCALCDQPMTPGQVRGEARDGAPAHASCIAFADQHLGMEHLDAISQMREAAEVAAREQVKAWLTDPAVIEGIASATRAAIPSKATQLRRLMDHAADALDKRVAVERKYDKIEAADVAAMVEASTVLRTVAIYVMDAE